MSPKVLLITPGFDLQGGISEFNRMICCYSSCDITPFFLSSGGRRFSLLLRVILSLYDFTRFIIILWGGDYNIIHVNPSLNKKSLQRDSIYVWISKLMGKKVFVHWHGWNPANEHLLKRYYGFLKKTLFRADHVKFLSPSFKKPFVKSGFRQKTSLGNTFVDDSLLGHDSFNREDNGSFNILFLSTISRNKGIYIALETFRILTTKYPYAKLTIAGTGPELEAVKKMVTDKRIPNVKFTGYVSGPAKRRIYSEANVYLFPSSYEGMPFSVIEAMAFGVPVVCSSVGAIPDFFIDGKMGFLVKENSPDSYAKAVKSVISGFDLRRRISLFNREFINKHFLASTTVRKIDTDYKTLVTGNRFN